MAALTDPSPQALVPNRRQLNNELCPSIRAILARLWTIQDAPLAVVPSRAPGSAASNEAPTGSAPRRVKPRYLANPHSTL